MNSTKGPDGHELLTFECWNQWRERCAAALCSQTCADALRVFGFVRFRTYVQRLNRPVELPSAEVCWHLFESRIALQDSRPGKSAKNWLFARTRDPDQLFDAVQGGASLIMRDVVRDWIRRECPPREQVSLDVVAPGTDLPLISMVPCVVPARDTVEDREDAQLADALAVSMCNELPDKAKRLLAACSEGLSLNHPGLDARTGCGRSARYTLWHRLLHQVADAVKDGFAEENAAYQLHMAGLVLESLQKKCKKMVHNVENQDSKTFVLENPSNVSGGHDE